MKTILAPIDFSSVSDAVVAEAAALAKALSGRVVLLAVVQPPAPVAEYAPMLQDIAEITAAGEKAAAKRLAKLEQQLAEDFVSCESVQLVGAPMPHILSEAERVGADYIVMGSHGHTALYDLLVGSTTHGVLKRATCPVIIIPAARSVGAGKAKKKEAAAI